MPRMYKRNFDEIDAFAMPEFRKRAAATGPAMHPQPPPLHQHKRNFDEIDAFAMPSFKRSRPHTLRSAVAQQLPSASAQLGGDEQLTSLGGGGGGGGSVRGAHLLQQQQQRQQRQQQQLERFYKRFGPTISEAADETPNNGPFRPEFDEVERTAYSDIKPFLDESASSSSAAAAGGIVGKRNFDEIDQFAMPQMYLLQSSLKRKQAQQSAGGGKQKKRDTAGADEGQQSRVVVKRDVQQAGIGAPETNERI